MPIVIVVCRRSIPTAVVRLDRVMSPAKTGIGAGQDNALTKEAFAQTSGA